MDVLRCRMITFKYHNSIISLLLSCWCLCTRARPQCSLLRKQNIPLRADVSDYHHLLSNTVDLFEPYHETMALFLHRKLVLKTRILSHPVGLDV